MSDFIEQNLNPNVFSSTGSWSLLSPIEKGIKQKIERLGTPLKNWDIQINYGIKTGFNDAFIIDEDKRNELIAADPKSAEIIRPILSGKNIKRYQVNWDNKWIIFTRRGIDIEQYPSIKAHLELEYDNLRPRNSNEPTGRKPGSYKWFEIQDNVAYFKDFDKQKIAWGNLALNGQFALVEEGYYINAPSSFIATDKIHLIAILNSRLADFYIKQLGVTRNGGYFEYKPMFVEQLPIPEIPEDMVERLLILVDKLKNEPLCKIQTENEIDDIIYSLYDITNEESQHIYNSALLTSSTSTGESSKIL